MGHFQSLKSTGVKEDGETSTPPTPSMFTGALQVLLQVSFVIDLPLFCGSANLIFQTSSLHWSLNISFVHLIPLYLFTVL